jgi:hypothetical protein
VPCPSVGGVKDAQDSLTSAWRDAAADLGIDVTTPFDLEGGSRSSSACIAWVADFGSSRGTVVVGRRSATEDIRSIADSRAMYYSEIDEASYSRYDRALFVATLNDWGWRGDPSAVPGWYTGESWS